MFRTSMYRDVLNYLLAIVGAVAAVSIIAAKIMKV